MESEAFQLTKSEIERLVTLGSLAPSGGNIQPWRVVVASRTLEIYLDCVRSTSFIDVERYASIFSLGSFAENVIIASEALGLVYDFRFIGYESIDKPLAKFEYYRRSTVQVNNFPLLYNQIEKRITNRKLFDGKIIEQDLIDNLKKVATQLDGLCELWTISSEQDKKIAAQILGKADRIRMHHPKLHEQMFGELRWNKQQVEQTQDGIDIDTLELPTVAVKLLSILRYYKVARRFFPQKVIESMPKSSVLGCSHFCCLSVKCEINPENLFIAGRILQRLWLTATEYNLAVQPWTVLPFFLIRTILFPGSGFSEAEEHEVRELGQKIKTLFGMPQDSFPLFLFRISKTSDFPSVRSLRVPWEMFTEIKNQVEQCN
ncbi:MAG: nitroreductase family protein [Microcoleaceae cyanobacterium MO_207.B10]|nr:nitroreductase family protein [Microcoleaceae cyanobacterium MO_207.B10]